MGGNVFDEAGLDNHKVAVAKDISRNVSEHKV